MRQDDQQPLPHMGVERDANLLDQSDLSKLRSLVSALETGTALIHRAPFSSVANLLADIFLSLPSAIFSANLSPSKYKGLEFVESMDMDDDYQEGDPDEISPKNRVAPRTISKDIFFDPLSGGQGKYYRFLGDPLGNPLQVEIDFPNAVQFCDRDRKTLSQFFEDLAQVLYSLASGVVDWRLIKHLRRFYVPKGPKTQPTPEQKNRQYHYHRRNRETKRAPIKGVQK